MTTRTPSVRVFISSTFRDMNAERDYLNSFVFPRIKEYCSRRYLDFTHIDLRWGIPEEDSRNGLVLTTCMEEIDNSRPFFIGILGERYGWTPSLGELDALRPAVESQRQWLTDKINQRASITEMELEYGVLRDMNMPHACFFIKRPDDDIPKEFKEAEGSDASQRLKSLKTKIKGQTKYPVHDYSKPDELGATLYDELIAMIEAEYPSSDNDRETAVISRHEYALATKSQTLFDLSNTRGFFDRWIKEGKRVLLLQGPSGSGTSWALAYCTADLRKVYSDNKILYYDFECANPSLAPMDDFLEFMSFNQCRLPADEWNMVAIDNCSMLTEDEVTRMIHWIDSAGANTHIVIAAANQSPLALSLTFNLKGPNINFNPLPVKLRRQFINNYTRKYSKRLTSEQIDALANGKSGNYPTALKMSLNAVVNYGLMEGLDDFIKGIAKNEQDFLFYDLIRKGDRLFSSVNLRKEYFQVTSALSLAPCGLSEQDLLGIFDIPQSKWAVIKPYVLQFCKGNSRRLQFINSQWYHQMDMYWSTNIRAALGLKMVCAILNDRDMLIRNADTVVATLYNIWRLPFDDMDSPARVKEIIYKCATSPDIVLQISNNQLDNLWLLAKILKFQFNGQPEESFGKSYYKLPHAEAEKYCKKQAIVNISNNRCDKAAYFLRLAAKTVGNISPDDAVLLNAEALLEEGKAKSAISLLEQSGVLPARHGLIGLFSRKSDKYSPLTAMRAYLLMIKAYTLRQELSKAISTFRKYLDLAEAETVSTDEMKSVHMALLCEYIGILSQYGDSDSINEAIKLSNDIAQDIANLGIDNQLVYKFMWAKAVRSWRKSDWKALYKDIYWCQIAARLCFGMKSYQYGRAYTLATYTHYKIHGELPDDPNGSAMQNTYRIRGYLRTISIADSEEIDKRVNQSLLEDNKVYDNLLVELKHSIPGLKFG